MFFITLPVDKDDTRLSRAFLISKVETASLWGRELRLIWRLRASAVGPRSLFRSLHCFDFGSGKKLCRRKKKIVTSTTKWGKKRAQVHTYCTTDRHRQRPSRGAGEKLTRASPMVPPTSRAGYDLNLSSLTKLKDCTTHPLRTPPPPGAPAPHPSLLGIFHRNEMEM